MPNGANSQTVAKSAIKSSCYLRQLDSHKKPRFLWPVVLPCRYQETIQVSKKTSMTVILFHSSIDVDNLLCSNCIQNHNTMANGGDNHKVGCRNGY